MTAYLIRLTAIWGLSLLLFHLLLRRETGHTANRLYLLLTLAGGILLPLLPAPTSALIYAAPVPQPVRSLMLHPDPMEAGGTAFYRHAAAVLWLVYLVGAGLVLLQLAGEALRLVRMYRSGSKTMCDGLIVIETGGTHGPFSLMHFLFVDDRASYTAREWEMVLAHERRHARLWHAADLLLIQLLQVLFWFHPLIYRYRRSLQLVHEYQADAAIPVPVKEYAGFLVEQSLLRCGPPITHSFQHSPIKNRIRMLTLRPATGRHRTRLLVALPLTFLSVFCFMKMTQAQKMEQKGNKIFYKGNVIELTQPRPDTVTVMDPKTGETKIEVTSMVPTPVRVNGKPVYREDQATPPKFQGPDNSLTDYLFRKLQQSFGELEDGNYIINVDNVIADERGQIVFYSISDIVLQGGSSGLRPAAKMADKLKQHIAETIEGAPGFTAPVRNGRPVLFMFEPMFGFEHPIHVEGHRVSMK